MMMVINEGATMRTSSIFVKSRTKRFTRTKVADPVAFAPGGLFNKTQWFILHKSRFFYWWRWWKIVVVCTWSLSRKPSPRESHPRSFSQFVCNRCNHHPSTTLYIQIISSMGFKPVVSLLVTSWLLKLHSAQLLKQQNLAKLWIV